MIYFDILVLFRINFYVHTLLYLSVYIYMLTLSVYFAHFGRDSYPITIVHTDILVILN